MEKSKLKPEILIVDDIPGNLNYISDILYNEGFGITVATNGLDAVDIALEKIPELILLDIAMPKMDGYEVCKILKSNPRSQEIPIIFLTAKDEHEDIIKGFQAGAVDYISKPFNTSELISRVKTHLDLKIKSEELKQLNQKLEDMVSERTAQLMELNQNLTDANQNLSKAYLELSKLDKAKNDFIRHINHELRTPLQGINGLVKILVDINQNPEEKEYLTSIEILVKRLVKLSELSLLFTEIRTDNYKLELQEVSLYQCIFGVLQNSGPFEKNIDIHYEPLPGNLSILADEKLLSACINIVLDNAVKYSPENGQIIIESFKNEGKILLEISDNGPGFSKKASDQLFDLFTADNIDEEFYGFGIGLATAKRILDLLSSELEIANKPRGGAIVRLIFPAL